MSDQSDILEKIVALIYEAPSSAAALTLYALAMTMNYEQAGCLFKLNKLRDLDTQQRQLAYELMEFMAERGNEGEAWDAALAEMNALIRAA